MSTVKHARRAPSAHANANIIAVTHAACECGWLYMHLPTWYLQKLIVCYVSVWCFSAYEFAAGAPWPAELDNMAMGIRDMHTYTDFAVRTTECHGKHDLCLSLDAYAAQFFMY